MVTAQLVTRTEWTGICNYRNKTRVIEAAEDYRGGADLYAWVERDRWGMWVSVWNRNERECVSVCQCVGWGWESVSCVGMTLCVCVYVCVCERERSFVSACRDAQEKWLWMIWKRRYEYWPVISNFNVLSTWWSI